MPDIRVLIADDHTIFREGVRALLESAPGIEVVGEAADGRDAIDRSGRLRPDIVLMDIQMPGLGGLEAALEIRRAQPEVKIVVLTQFEDREYIRRFLKAGVSGYVLKKAAGSDLIAAIRAAARGGLALDPGIARGAVEEMERPSGGDGGVLDSYEMLTDREKQVLKLVAEGHTNKDVAQTLGISVKTAMSHRERIMEKLDLHNRTELIRFALRKAVIR
jgi:two-component system, NarL family, response regulator NreC